MEPIDYIKTFKMAEDNYEFNRTKFVKQFKEDYLEYLENDQLGLDANGKMHFERFKEITASFLQKFNAISRLKAQMRTDNIGLTKKFWGYIYAHVILPERAIRFPHEHEVILRRTAKRKANKAMRDAQNGPNP